MDITILGYGKMGKAVEKLARERGHEVTVVSPASATSQIPRETDCVIEFTHATAAPGLIHYCIDQGIPVVSGTTGWDTEVQAVQEYCRSHQGTMLWAPNFSVGVHILSAINLQLAALMDKQPEYEVTITEVHHTAKKDKPSGTAIMLAKQILSQLRKKSKWGLRDESKPSESDTLEITAIREEEVKGIHDIIYTGPFDTISLRHEAGSRDAFAFGAVLAAEWLKGRKGVFSFGDVMSFQDKG